MKSTYDVFISYNTLDRDLVEKFVKALPTLNLSPFLDIWDLTPGKPWQEELESALSRSRHVAIFIGGNGIGRWQNEEMRIAIDRRTIFSEINIIPVLLPNADVSNIPKFLTRFTWVDFRNGINNKNEYDKFISSLGITDPILVKNNIFTDRKITTYNTISLLKEIQKDGNIGKPAILKEIASFIAFIIFYLIAFYSLYFFFELKFLNWVFISASVLMFFIMIIYLFFDISEIKNRTVLISELINTMRENNGLEKIKIYNSIIITPCDKCNEKTPALLLTDSTKLSYTIKNIFLSNFYNVLVLLGVISIPLIYFGEYGIALSIILIILVFVLYYIFVPNIFKEQYICLLCDSVYKKRLAFKNKKL